MPNDPDNLLREILNICADGADRARPGAGDSLREHVAREYPVNKPVRVIFGVDTWTCNNCRTINPFSEAACGLCGRRS